MQKATKTLSLLFFLCLVSYTLQAAKTINESDLTLFLDAPETEVLDHTATRANKQIDHTVDFQDLDDENLTDDVDTFSFKAKNNPVLLTVILSNKQVPRKKANKLEPKDDEKQVEQEGQGYVVQTAMHQVGANGIYKKYVLDANGLLNPKAHNSAQKLGYHIIQTGPAHIVVALMQWGRKSNEKYIYDIAINVPVCGKCQYLLTLMGCTINVKSHEKGCQLKPFPWPMPPLAMEYLNGAILNSGKPLEMTQTLLQRILGISETSYNALKDELNKTQLKLENKNNLLEQLKKNNNEALTNKENEIERLKNQFKLELNKTQIKLNNKDNLLNKTQLKLENKNKLLEQLKKNNNEVLINKNNEIERLKNQFKEKENQFKLELNKKEKALVEAQQLVNQLLKRNDKPQNNMKVKPQPNNNKKKYKGKVLPQDLSGQNLSGYDFTGCRFTYTNLAYTDLTNVILTNTACDYQQAFQDNSIKNELKGGDWYKNNLPKDLKSIAQVYPKLNSNSHKVKLLQVASAFSQLPFYEGTEFYIKLDYWSSELLQLKQALGKLHANQDLFGWLSTYGEMLDQHLICSLQSDLEYDAEKYCWTTQYPQDKVNIEGKALHANFDTYLKDFTNGLTKYQCKSILKFGFNWYEKQITKNIEGLAATYPHIKEKQLQQEACAIAHALSKSYQSQKGTFQHHYLFFQHRLIRLKKSVGVGVKNKVHYNFMGDDHL